ncbi:hypothetical protein SAMD00019534_112730 [Acytostelium subglobosum LB1]|uniref:hypothetical protein n=1 Tax=Acytostelium subglobosum LB1 TaxID=1410327 RepID=UPI00064505F5|nr:hypothetical protein SAMD00019534_112730 [Acytostelium subglobosum LB1]GAM28097.1 hypothetical protein SAMD00019534_112730 [Acytostelium subglobosum LB1]|eukprot:XP_012749056.1 hypothetical protein SAMD00019534_112730 [Acytostelium subglobosum LB1]
MHLKQEFRSLELRKQVAFVGAAGSLLFALLLTYEFIELITNIFYSIVLTILIVFCVQNRYNAIKLFRFLYQLDVAQIDIYTQWIYNYINALATGTTPPTLPPRPSSATPSTSPTNNDDVDVDVDDINNTINDQHQTNYDQELPIDTNGLIFDNLSDQETIDKLYDQIKELNLTQFSERANRDRERLVLHQKIKLCAQAISDSQQERAKWKQLAEQHTLKYTELTRERDQLVTSEQRHLSKINDYERKERFWNDSERALLKRISELKESNSSLKKESEDKQKKISKLEDNVNKVERKISHSPSASPRSSSPVPHTHGAVQSSTLPIPISGSVSRKNSFIGAEEDPAQSDTTKFKSLFKKVKNKLESSKIINKAQDRINKHLHPENYPVVVPTVMGGSSGSGSPPSTTTAEPTTISATPTTVHPILFADDKDIFDDGADTPKIVVEQPDIFTFEDGDKESTNPDTLDDLLILGTTTTSSSTSSSSSSLFGCIKEHSSKESENRTGLRRAKKKPPTPDASMMEDTSFACYPFNNSSDMALFGVFDGHAGRVAAEYAKQQFPIEVAKIITEQPGLLSSCDMSDMLLQAFANIDHLMKTSSDHLYVGCTATISFIWTSAGGDRYLQIANVGDTSAYMCRNGQCVELTYSHKASDPLEKKRLIESGIEVSKEQTRINGLSVSRSLGDHFLKDQNIGLIGVPYLSKPILLKDTDSLLVMASDGLWDVCSGHETIGLGEQYITRGANSLCSSLLQRATDNPECNDNVSIIVVRL